MTSSPQDFDFDKWLEDAERPERSVTVYQKSGLIADLDALAAKIENADEGEDADGPSMGGGIGKLRAEYAKLAQQFRDSALTIRVQSLTQDEQREIATEHKDMDAYELGSHTLSRAITSPPMTPKQVQKLARVIGDGQFARITAAYRQACNEVPAVSADFLPKPSTRGNGGES